MLPRLPLPRPLSALEKSATIAFKAEGEHVVSAARIEESEEEGEAVGETVEGGDGDGAGTE